jgi:cell pole-organizing protein PopZ
MSDPNAQEPTMEEILASIRRIISEDEPAPTPSTEAQSASPPHGDEHDIGDEEDDDVLELTQRAEESPADSMFESAGSEPETSGDLEIYERPAPQRPSYTPAEDTESDFGDLAEDEALVSAPAAASASSAFDQLNRTVSMPLEGRTLEDVVRELLRPLLKDWLDRNLPDIVEQAVQTEVERISRRRFS